MTALNTELLNVLLWLQAQPEGITFVDLNKFEPQPTFFTFILGTFKLIGIGLLVVAVIGGVIGLLRIWVRRRFPENRLNGIDVEPLTFLHLNEHSEAEP
ncbi:MAG: hypothetical protein ACRD1X_19920 [Vicinamibacteria bacterium]